MSKRGSEQKPKAPEFHNSPFKDLKKQFGPKPDPTATAKPRPGPTPPAPAKDGRRRAVAEDDETLFALAMGGVLPIEDRPQAPERRAVQAKLANDDAEAMAELAEMVAGQGPFQFAPQADAIEGLAPGVDRRVALLLRKGEFPVQARLELQGLTPTAAHEALERFLQQAGRDRLRCVLLVHGTGPASREQLSSLQAALQGWLARGRLAKIALAITTARPQDGGTGALCVLLRR